MNLPQVPHRNTMIAALVLGTLALYARTAGFAFVNFDDPVCVTDVAIIKEGLTWRGLIWAFTDGVPDSHYKPLVNLTHMLDCELFGLNAGGHHVMNVLWHTAAAALLFLALERMTAAPWRSWIVAAVFAWHPTHVESVAWVTERKDVLSGFFWMLALWAHARYAERPCARRYLAVSAAVLGAMLSKSMAVTLPFTLMLVDFWPLKRVRVPLLTTPPEPSGETRISLGRCVLEKVPFLALAALVAFVAMRVAGATDALGGQQTTTAGFRAANGLLSYVRYLGMSLWPADLSVVYPLPTRIPAWHAVTSAAVLALILGVSVLQARRRPWLLMGWLWYLGTLVPVIGFIQMIRASHADRYTYIAQTGFVLMVVWTVAEWLKAQERRLTARALTVLTLGLCIVATWLQTGHWRDTEALFRRAVAATRENWIAHLNLAGELMRQGRHELSEPHVREGYRLKPDSPEARQVYATLLTHKGRHSEARALFQSALRQRAGDPAVATLLAALRRDAAHPSAGPEEHYNFANALLAFDRTAEAIEPLRRVIALRTNYAAAHVDLGLVLFVQGNAEEAMRHYRAALAIEPTNSTAHANLGGLLSDRGQLDEALPHLLVAHGLQPANGATRYNLALALAKRGRHAEAVPHFREILRAQPNHNNALNKLAWILATSSDDSIRDGTEALLLASRLQQATGRKQPLAFDTEAAALAEMGKFSEALQAATKAVELLRDAGGGPNIEAIQSRAESFRAGKPWREPATPVQSPKPVD